MVRKSATGRIGIADVAVKAGVSHATVSRVMNGNYTVDPDIAARVRAAAAELKYQPNPVGRSLALGKTDTIGIVVPDLANPTFQAILRGLSRAAPGRLPRPDRRLLRGLQRGSHPGRRGPPSL